MHWWTYPSVIMKDYVVPPEKLLYYTRCYHLRDIFMGVGFIFLTLVLWAFILPVLVMDLLPVISVPFLLIAGMICASNALTSFLKGFDNVFFVTTDKLIYTRRTSFFGRKVDPTHLDNVASAQAVIHAFTFGILGTLNISLRQFEEGNQHLYVGYIFASDEVAAVVENAIDLMRNRMYSETQVTDQEPQIAHIRTEAPA